ncbi:MAG: Ni/Fe hydrogenase subunit alpha [Candidatus Bathyarchaeia archaeon]
MIDRGDSGERGKVVTISPVTRLEGHAKVEIILDDNGNVQDTYLQVVELRGFERFCQGRLVEELPGIMPRICGVCPSAHHIASAKAVDAVFGVEPTETAKKLRELFYCAHIIHSHIAHFYVLAGPDLLVGPTGDPRERNIFGVFKKLGMEFGRQIITNRKYAQRVQELMGGKATHPVFGLPGGVSKPLSVEERDIVEEMFKSMLDFASTGLSLWEDSILKQGNYVDLIKGDAYYLETYYIGMVDRNNKVNFYEGEIRAVDPKGREAARFKPKEYLDFIGEHVEPWSYLKFPFLKNIGWRGITDGEKSGVYRVNSLARLNASEGMATPLAQEAYEKMYEFFGGRPVHATLAFHWGRLIETLYAAERGLELLADPEIMGQEIKVDVARPVGEGVGVVEAPRGTLYHHYITDDKGIVQKVNLIVATVQNNAAMSLSVKKAASNLIRGWKVSEGILNMVEMAIRAYDPCFGCATHTLIGQMPLELNIRKADGEIYKTIIRP